MNLTRIPSKPDFVQEVYDTLLSAITDGHLSPGTRIKQEDLAGQLNVSRSPILLALRLLKKDGLLCDAGGRGLIVTPVNPAEIRQLYQMRGAIDTLAARLAAARHAHISEAILRQGRDALNTQDVRDMIDADMAFHNAIYEASGNSFIVSSATLHWIHVRRAQGWLLQYREDWAAICDEHEEIAQAISSGNGELAVRLSEMHTELVHRGIAGDMITIDQTELPDEPRKTKVRHGQDR